MKVARACRSAQMAKSKLAIDDYTVDCYHEIPRSSAASPLQAPEIYETYYTRGLPEHGYWGKEHFGHVVDPLHVVHVMRVEVVNTGTEKKNVRVIPAVCETNDTKIIEALDQLTYDGHTYKEHFEGEVFNRPEIMRLQQKCSLTMHAWIKVLSAIESQHHTVCRPVLHNIHDFDAAPGSYLRTIRLPQCSMEAAVASVMTLASSWRILAELATSETNVLKDVKMVFKDVANDVIRRATVAAYKVTLPCIYCCC
jgi:hypothetical protein